MELVDKYDKRRAKLNKITERYADIDGEFSSNMHLWIMNDKDEFLIQKRSMNKRVKPGFWSITGGGVETGEHSYDSAIREAKEELDVDIKPEELSLMLSLKRKYYFTDVYLVKKNVRIEDITMQVEEVDEVKWSTVDEIKQMMKDDIFTSSATMYMDLLLDLINEEQNRNGKA